MGVNFNPGIVTDGLVLALDAANTKSYPGTGTTWFDQSGNGRNGTLTNSPTFSNNTATFNGTSQRIEFADDSELDFLGTASYTLEAFVKPASSGWTATSWRGIFNRESNPGSGRDGYNLWINWNGTDHDIASERYTSGTALSAYSTNYSSEFIRDNNHHIVATYDGSNIKLYVNSELKLTTADTSSITNTSQTFQIGSRGTQSSTHFPGEINVAKVYNRALSASEVSQNYEALRGRFGL